MMSDQALIDIEHVSEHLGVKVNTVYSWVNQRKIPYVKVGRLIKFNMPLKRGMFAMRGMD